MFFKLQMPLLDLPGITSDVVTNVHLGVLAAADEVTGTNNEDGIARVLERLAEIPL